MTTILLTAAITALTTLMVLALWAHCFLQPRLRRGLKRDLDEEARKAADLIAGGAIRIAARFASGPIHADSGDAVRNLAPRPPLYPAS